MCYALSLGVGGGFLSHPSARRKLTALQQHVSTERSAGHLFFYLVSLRVFPFSPNWFINLASPWVRHRAAVAHHLLTPCCRLAYHGHTSHHRCSSDCFPTTLLPFGLAQLLNRYGTHLLSIAHAALVHRPMMTHPTQLRHPTPPAMSMESVKFMEINAPHVFFCSANLCRMHWIRACCCSSQALLR